MRFALVNGERFEAFKGGVGICPNCKSEVIARCGSIRPSDLIAAKSVNIARRH